MIYIWGIILAYLDSHTRFSFIFPFTFLPHGYVGDDVILPLTAVTRGLNELCWTSCNFKYPVFPMFSLGTVEVIMIVMPWFSLTIFHSSSAKDQGCRVCGCPFCSTIWESTSWCCTAWSIPPACSLLFLHSHLHSDRVDCPDCGAPAHTSPTRCQSWVSGVSSPTQTQG